jgi:hypothetical protein
MTGWRNISPAIDQVEWIPDNLLDLIRVWPAIVRDKRHEFFNIRMKIPQEESLLLKMKQGNFLILCT